MNGATMTSSLTTADDNTLISMALAGQAECFTVLMDRHLFVVRRYILSMVRNTADTDDLVQEVLMKVWRNLSKFRAEASFRTWMTRIAINEVLQKYRKDRHRSRFDAPENLDSFASACDTPHQHLVRTESIQELRKLLEKLPEIYKEVLILREVDELSMQETADYVRASIPAVKSRLFRARTLLSASVRRPFPHAKAA
jgi:RNA polymerase sigma-70 factor, ECF subfamily